MDNITELNSKYDAVASHIRQMDIQIAQTAETIKKQHGTLPRKTYKNPKDCNVVELRSGRHLSDPVAKKLTAQEKGKQKEGEPPSLEDVHDDDHEPEQPTTAEPVAPTTPDRHVPARVYTPKVPYPVPTKKSRKDCEEMKYKKMLEELNVKFSLMDAIQMIPSIDLGLHEDLHAVLHVLGIADLCHRTHPLYPDLVRQVLATAELTFKRPGFLIFEEAYFTFFASGVKHSITLEALTEVYGMSEEYTQTSFPRKFVPEHAFWKFIASGDFKSRSASQSHICNPVLRIAAKMLCAGVEDELKSSDIGIPTVPMTTSPGCVLAQMFVDKKARVVKGSLQKDRSGSLLTPLFRHLELDHSVYQCNETAAFIDIPYLINCQILCDENTYSFLSQDGRNLYCKLPQPNITSLSDVTNICFVPDAQYLCADPKSSYRDDTMDDVESVRTMEATMHMTWVPLMTTQMTPPTDAGW
ncbi:hypothetical protein F2Q69_00020678 [Brassica cretica]|uniref:Arabidopsis retrotransposon Orf1 C-terminal domain-containing protein n=1 Tax=Brassica cretica TaxID=69181 RepID=A0A8S9QM71_BRACR|nr:hypothetical protein F2Q69_00020678 [Brassica cretica]